MSKLIYVIVGACTLGILFGVGLMTYIAQQQLALKAPPTQVPVAQNPPVAQIQLEAPIVRAGTAWLPFPEKISQDLQLLDISKREDGEDDKYDEVTYYKTGTRDGINIIVAEVTEECMGGCQYYVFFEQRPEGYMLIEKASSSGFINTNGTYIGPKKTNRVAGIDIKTTYEDLQLPSDFLFGGVSFVRGTTGIGYIPAPDFYTKNMTKITDLSFGALYSQVEELSEFTGQAMSQMYYVREKNGMTDSYVASPDIEGDDMVMKVTWSNGQKNKEAYQQISTGGCGGGGGTPILSDNSLAGLVQSGTTSLGPVYEFKDGNAALLKSVYEIVKLGSEKPMPYKRWLTKHPVIVFKDALGRALLYNNTSYGPQVECGKPVVYLYPTITTRVSVRVGADMTISEPTYTNGWTVVAQPNGLLRTTNGNTYGSLYWEGFGHGAYPKIDKGFVVAQKDVEQTLRAHLSALGLNAKESAEFLDFWLSKMPHTQYVRLSWLGTQEMNMLAPMDITPRPDSVIRIFLDFEGLDHPISLKPQTLIHIPRNGFTVVEWGGLLKK